MKRRFVACLSALLLLCAFATGCLGKDTESSSGEENSLPFSTPEVVAEDYPVTVNGVTLSVVPKRVAIFSPSLAEIAADMSYGARLVGRAEECDYPAYVEDLPSLGKALLPDEGGIAALQPDLLIFQQEPPKDFREWAESNRFPILVIPPAANIEGLSDLYMAVGQALGGKESGATAATAFLKKVTDGLEEITASLTDQESVAGLYVADKSGAVATPDTVIGRLLTTAGLANAAEAGEKWELPEDALQKTEVIFCPKGKEEGIKSSALFKSSPAVKAGKVYGVDIALVERQGLRLVEGARSMATILFPEIFPTTTPDEEA